MRFFWLKLGGTFFLALFVMVFFASRPPEDFPVGQAVHIPKNTSLSDVSNLIWFKHAITSPFLFESIIFALYGQRKISAGDYLFKEPSNIWTVANRMAKGEQGLTKIKITIPEGSTSKDIAWILLKNIPDFDAPYFAKITANSEGYLFPDTYFFYQNSSPEEIMDSLKGSFKNKINSFSSSISLSGRKLEDIITMASIVEREAANSTDRAIIAGILWKRLDKGMPLQVDVALDTYEYKGLPRGGPIANPGINSLKAVLNPTQTKYFYYLSDKNGIMHYAVDHDGHVANRRKYLNK